MKHVLLLLGTLLLSAGVALAQTTPPEYLNYQGVLRDASDDPLDGPHDMVFRFYDAAGDATCTGGTLLLTDAHEAAGTGAVDVSGGMFNVGLGGGSLTSGMASTLAEVFRNNAEVWLEPTVGGEKLCPRIRVLSAGYALNASYLGGLETGSAAGQIPISNGILSTDLNADLLDGFNSSSFGRRTGTNSWSGENHFSNSFNSFTGDGSGLTGVSAANADLLDSHDSTYFLDTSSAAQLKLGTLSVDVTGGGVIPAISATSDFYGIDAAGNSAGGYFRDGNGSAYSYVGSGETGIYAYGNSRGAAFSDLDSSGEADVAVGDYGIDARGNLAGGYFHDRNEIGYAYVGYGGKGIEAHGSQMGGLFVDDDGSGQANLAHDHIGIVAYGNLQAGYFDDSDGSGKALVAYGDLGIQGEGNTAGGYFRDLNSSGYAYVGHGNTGITAKGSNDAGYFENTTSSTWVRVANPYGDGIAAHGTNQGGFFQDDDSTGKAHVAYGDTGIEAEGSQRGGYFKDTDGSGIAYAGYGNVGIHAEGSTAGGYFECPAAVGWGYAYVGYNNQGIHAVGDLGGGVFSTGGDFSGLLGMGIRAYGFSGAGFFKDSNDLSEAYVATGGYGITADGGIAGGHFRDQDSSSEARVAYDTYKISGTGSQGFVQNHPYDASKVIVYTAPESAEVATYTRGSARIAAGEARVALGQTFAWVTNPDIGLTAHVTPRDRSASLYLAELGTEELVVRSDDPADDDTVFDYLVYGLRIGFEDTTVVQPKQWEAFIPSMNGHRAKIANDPSLASHTAMSRFRVMEDSVLGTSADTQEFSRADDLRAAIHEYDPSTDPPLREMAEFDPAPPSVGAGGSAKQAPGAADFEDDPSADRAVTVVAGAAVRHSPAPENDPETPVNPDRLFAAAETVETGDLVAFDRDRPDLLVRASTPHDPGFVGVAAGESVRLDDEMRVALVETHYAIVKADAGYGEIRRGDLLTTSPTPGHAMLTVELIPGTIVGKALEPLDAGTGLIRVLVMYR